jgi:glycogen(starch) synthase
VTTVALVASSYWPRVGGVEEHVRRLAGVLHARGHRVVVWAVDRGDDVAGADDVVPGVRVRYLPAPLAARSARSVRDLAFAAPGAAAAWWRAAAQDRPDVVHVQCYGPNGPWATALAAARRLPLVVGVHGETYMDESRVFDTSALMRRALPWSLRRARAVTACSHHAAADLARFGRDPARTVVVANGVDPAEPAGPPPSWLPGRYLLALGRMVHVKGFDLLLRAFARARVERLVDDDVRLVLAGDGPERAALRSLAGELGVADRVVLPGALGRPDVVATVAGALGLVVPSRVEAFGIVVLEGLRAGVPVVATTRGGPREIVTDGVDGLLADPEDAAALAGALGRLGDAGLRHRLGEAGRATAARYMWEAVANRVEAVYARVLRA